MRTPILIVSLLIFCAGQTCFSTGGYASDVALIGNPEPVQGEIFHLSLLAKDRIDEAWVEFEKQRVYLKCFGKRARGIFGFDLGEAPGVKRLKFGYVIDGRAKELTRRVSLKKADFPVQRIDGVDDAFVNPGKKEMGRIRKESKTLSRIWGSSSREIFWEGDFILPFEGFDGVGFGRQRIINGQARNPHTGLDSRADMGTPVRVVNSGVVRFAKDLYFSGNSVIIDHGGGLFSMYFHLKNMGVAPGEVVRKGDVIGHVGDTGRATGPHLHLGVRFVNQRVDPKYLLKQSLKKR